MSVRRRYAHSVAFRVVGLLVTIIQQEGAALLQVNLTFFLVVAMASHLETFRSAIFHFLFYLCVCIFWSCVFIKVVIFRNWK